MCEKIAREDSRPWKFYIETIYIEIGELYAYTWLHYYCYILHLNWLKENCFHTCTCKLCHDRVRWNELLLFSETLAGLRTLRLGSNGNLSRSSKQNPAGKIEPVSVSPNDSRFIDWVYEMRATTIPRNCQSTVFSPPQLINRIFRKPYVMHRKWIRSRDTVTCRERHAAPWENSSLKVKQVEQEQKNFVAKDYCAHRFFLLLDGR